MITLLVQPCTVTIGFSSAAVRSHSFLWLMWGLFSGWGDSPLRIGCKVSVMVTQSGVVLDNVTRWKWVKEIGNHQYAPCVNWRRSWFMAPGYSVHTCWIYSFFFFFLCRLAQGQVRVPFSAAHPHHHAVCGTLWWTAPGKGQCVFKMNWAPSIGSHSDWATVPLVCRECMEWGNKRVRYALKCCTLLPVLLLIHLPLCMFHRLISHVRLSVSPFTWGLRQRGDSCGFSKASQQLQTPHGIASVQVSQRYVSQLKQVILQFIVGFSLVLPY